MRAFFISRGTVLPLIALLAIHGLAPALFAQSNSVRVDLGAEQSMELVRVEAGTFQQGSPVDEAGRGDDETQWTVKLARPFLLGKYPVTRGQFARFVAETGFRTDAEIGPSGGFGWDGAKLAQRKDFTWRNPGFAQADEHPVTLVSYKDADAFLRWLSRKNGRTFALPSEAQWEYAARAGGGAVNADAVAWHKGNSGNATHPVGQKSANAWGLSDMLGNVWEWCEDWYAPYAPGDATDPLQRDSTLSDKPRRVLRGGSWLREPKFCRPATRYRNDALSRNADNGFRVMTFQINALAAVPAAVVPPKPVELEATNEAAPKSAPARVEHEPAPIMRAAPVAGFGLGWLLLLPIVGVALLILRAIFRRLSGTLIAVSGGGGVKRGKVNDLPGQPLRVRVVDDGFWIAGEGLPAGAEIACRYTVGGSAQDLDVHFEPGPQGQFVFTGSRPSNVSVAMKPGFGSARHRGFSEGAVMASAIENEPPFEGPPPAY